MFNADMHKCSDTWAALSRDKVATVTLPKSRTAHAMTHDLYCCATLSHDFVIHVSWHQDCQSCVVKFSNMFSYNFCGQKMGKFDLE